MGGEGQGRNHDGRGVGHRAHLLPQTHQYTHTHTHTQNDSHRTCGEHWQISDFQKRARNPPHNWVEQMGKKREREGDKRNQDRTSTPEREL